MSLDVLVAPSILSADPLRFAEEIADAEAGGADWHHFDVMDGHFVPNLTFGPPLVRALKNIASKPIDVHIMVSNPDDVALDYVQAGAASLSFHVEVAQHAHRLCSAIRDAGALAGVAINPGTSLENLWPLLSAVDFINVMSVNPGFGGQSFIPESLPRIRKIRAMLDREGLAERVRIEVDGGINDKTAAAVVEAGANVLVAGSYVYGSKDRAGRIGSLQAIR